MGRILFISVILHVVVLAVVPLLGRLGRDYDRGLEVYEVELVRFEAEEPAPPVEEPVTEPEPEPVEESPVVEEDVEEEAAIPEEPSRKPKRTVLKPPPRQPRKSLEERLEERMRAQDETRPDTPEPEPRRERERTAAASTRITTGRTVPGWYASVIKGKVYSNWSQPSARLVTEDSLTATVSFVIQNDGSVSGVRIVRSSGRSTVDQSAISAVRSAAPFPSLADLEDYLENTLDVAIDFTIVRE
ncbi:MAG: TonB family protein [Candidatus Eisenbacteria bacterium]|nr:TonB family protein [Candidatus Eisenbacteria bacterium]